MACEVVFEGTGLERLCWRRASRRKPDRFGERFVDGLLAVEDDSL